MAIKTPSFMQYLLGLIAALCIFGLFFTLTEKLHLFAMNSLLALFIGLLLGHLIGSFVSIRPSMRVSPSSDAGEYASDQDEIQAIYVGNLPFKTTRHELRELFEPFGKVHSARIMIDKATRKPRGYGFVEMDSRSATKAINKLNGSTFSGRSIKVNEASQRN